MTETILVVNAGSSSIKFQLFSVVPGGRLERLLKGQIEGVGVKPHLIVRGVNGETLIDETWAAAEVKDVPAALDEVVGFLQSHIGQLPVAIGHRVVHGGPDYSAPTVVTEAVLKRLDTFSPLAPLHQPNNLAPIRAVRARQPELLQVACFDTSFHRGHSAVAELIPLPNDVRKTGVQRYGFHGISYEYIASVLPEVAPEIANGRVIVAHLGSGASLCALNKGKSVDTTMGFTAIDGLCMGTRPGAIDPGAVLYLFQNLGLSVKEVEGILYKKSGLLAVSGISNDMRDLLGNDEPGARLAVDYFVYRVTKEVGALAAVLGGVDGLVFTAGIGENSPEVRRRVCEASSWLGIRIDSDANGSSATRISTPQSKVLVCVIPTNEELMIALHTGTLLGLRSRSAEQAA